jgi:hypothetical protein
MAMSSDRKDRKERLTDSKSGAWASSSQDYLRLANDLFEQSYAYARRFDGNISPYPIAGIPLLVSTLRALLIEANSGMFGLGRDFGAITRLANDQNEIGLVSEKYVDIGSNAATELSLLYEVRNEIVHPAHMPAGTKHNTPLNMLPLRERGLLQSLGKLDSDYTWISQLQSHRLFRWSFVTVERVAKAVLERHHAMKDYGAFHVTCYGEYRAHDL